MNREPISCRAVNALTARWESFAARKAHVFERAVFNLAAYIDNNEFYLHENGPVGETHFHLNGFARRLDVKQRQRVTRKWPIVVLNNSSC